MIVTPTNNPMKSWVEVYNARAAMIADARERRKRISDFGETSYDAVIRRLEIRIALLDWVLGEGEL